MRSRGIWSNLALVARVLTAALILTTSHASSLTAWADAGEAQDDWQTYVSQAYGFALKYPAGWKVQTGNLHNNSLPPDITSLCSQRSVFDVSVIPLRKGTFVSSLDLIENAARAFWGSVSQVESGIRLVHGQEVGRAVYQKPAYEGIAVQIVITAFSTEVADYLVVTQLGVDPTSHAPTSLEYGDRLQTYERILQSLTLFPQQAKSPLPTFSDMETLDSGLDNDSDAAASGLDVASFWWPTDGIFGPLVYDTPVISGYAWNNYRHPGVDVWTNAQGTGDGRNPRYPSMGSNVYPVYEGTIVDWILDPRNGAKIGMIISHPNVNGEALWTTYWHLADEASGATFISDGLSRQQQVTPTTKLGNQGDRRYGTSGSITTHLHFSVLTGYPGTHYESFRTDPSPYFHRPVTHGWVDRSTPIRHEPPCPKSGGGSLVVFYKGANYTCGGQGEGVGYVAVPAPITACPFYPPAPVLLPLEHRPLSVKVPQGYYLKVHDRWETAATATIYGSDPSLWDGYFWSPIFGPRQMYSNVGSVEVYCMGCVSGQVAQSPSDGTCPANTSPFAPALQLPANGHVALDYLAPTLCWRNSGDAEGDQLQFYAEVYNSPISANSGWIEGTCWRPGQLDHQYHGYQWRVKARDPRSAESSWSSTWNFTIAAPNQPPNISFDTANGSGFTSAGIDSNARTWTFAGTASDPEGRLGSIAFRCAGEGCGGQASHTNGGNWSHTQANMAGRNDVYFEAFDLDGYNRYSRHLDLRVDLAPPNTTLGLNGDSNSANWPAWFTGAVEVHLQAVDGSTGSVRSGVQEIHYRVDGGAWQSQAADHVGFTVSTDGSHTVAYYAVDKVSNAENGRAITFQIDQTPPSAPSGVVETNGVLNDQWQKVQNVPVFTWAASSDITSGVWGYQFYFGPDPAGVSYQTFLAADPRQWTPQPNGVRTGIYYLRGRARDIAGNWTVWANLFTYRYDGTPPENPTGITHAAGIANDTWQRTSNLADFTWPVPHDEGSGIKGYNVYWGALQDGTSTDFVTANAYQSPTPVCSADEACVGYLRLRSMDNVDIPANDWTTAFTLRYDNVPPVAAFAFREGITTTQTLVHLQIAATDQGSGLQEMRLSGDGLNWVPWEVYATDRLWLIPAISRQWWPVYLQVRDGVGLESEVISHTVYLDVNAQQPRSANFRLFDHAMSAGAGEHTSAAYNGRSTVGQVADSARSNSLNFALVGGYQAGSQAIPIVEPGHDEFTFVNGIFASGTGASTLTSLTFRMAGTVGELGLPNNETTLVSQNHQHQPGFLAAVRPAVTPTPTPIPGPTPTPPPTPACASPSVTIDGAAPFTYNLNVTLGLCAPWATEMLISNNTDFTGATWEPYADSKAWTLTAAGQNVQPCFVYAAFKDAQGTVYTNYFDDIIYDPNPPTGSLATDENTIPSTAQASSDRVTVFGSGAAKSITRIGQTVLARPVALLAARDDGAVDLYITAQDDNSGLAEMQIGASAAFTDTVWEPYSALKPWTPEGGDGIKTAYARFRDSAGNISAAADVSFALDTLPPLGGLALDRRVVGPDVITTTVYFGAEDNLSGVSDMRVSEDSAFTDAAWQPYTVTLTWPISLTGVTEGALYAQYRDLAGNISEVYSDTYTVDTAPPVVYVEVVPGETLTRTVNVYAYDELADLGVMRITNDPLMVEDVITASYTPTITWTFDDRRVVWVQLSDSVGNWAEPYPAYAAPALAPQAPVTTITMMDGPTLTWTHLEANSYYQVWRDTVPYFDPTAPTADTVKLDDVYPPLGGTMTYTDTTADPNLTYYYAVVGVNALGQTSGPSNYVGVFRFGLSPGQ